MVTEKCCSIPSFRSGTGVQVGLPDEELLIKIRPNHQSHALCFPNLSLCLCVFFRRFHLISISKRFIHFPCLLFSIPLPSTLERRVCLLGRDCILKDNLQKYLFISAHSIFRDLAERHPEDNKVKPSGAMRKLRRTDQEPARSQVT